MDGRPRIFAASGNPLVQVLSLLVFGVVLVVAVLMGAVILAAVIGLAAIATCVVAVRLWWLRRKLRRAAERGGARGPELIEAEYTVIEERDPNARREARDDRREL